MANKKRRSLQKKHTNKVRSFSRVRGKVVERVEIDDAVQAITIVFQDKTVLSFDIEARLGVFPELSDFTTNWSAIKKWRRIQ